MTLCIDKLWILYIKGCWKSAGPSQSSMLNNVFLLPPCFFRMLQMSLTLPSPMQSTQTCTILVQITVIPVWEKLNSTMEIVVLSQLKFRLISTDNLNYSDFPLVGREVSRNGLLLPTHSCPLTHEFHCCSHLAVNIIVCSSL